MNCVVAPPRWWMWRPGAVRPAPRRFGRTDPWAGPASDVVRSADFESDVDQLRRGRRLCADFLLVQGDARHLSRVESTLWLALVELRRTLPLRVAVRDASNRPGLAAALAEHTRELTAVDRRIDEFAAALRVLADDVEPATLRHVAALDLL